MTKDDKLDQALALLNEIKTTQATQGEELIRLATCAKENKESIKGNHKPGLETNMALVQESLKRTQNILGAVASIVGIEIIALLFAILTHNLPAIP